MEKVLGSINIPRNVSSDFYYLRAYTNYMKNLGASRFFSKRIKIANPLYPNPVPLLIASDQKAKSCQVYPEGGIILNGIINTIGCRFTNTEGKGVQVNCKVIDQGNNVITSFQTYKNGFGSFKFIPQPGNSYTIEAINDDSQLLTRLTEAMNAGFSLSVDTITSEVLRLKVFCTGEVKKLKLTAWHEGIAYPLNDVTIDKPEIYNIPTSSCQKGL